MTSSFIVYLFLERISTKLNPNTLASSSIQDMFITNFNAICNASVLYLFYLFINKINLHLWNSFLNLHFWKCFKRLDKSDVEYKPTKESLWKIQVLGMAFGILLYVTLCTWYGANLFTRFQFGALNSEKDKKGEALWETNMKLCNMRFEKIKIWEGVNQS